jgi:hypothetical protein
MNKHLGNWTRQCRDAELHGERGDDEAHYRSLGTQLVTARVLED